VSDQTQKTTGPKCRVILLISRYTNEKHVGDGYKADGMTQTLKKNLMEEGDFHNQRKINGTSRSREASSIEISSHFPISDLKIGKLS
jgi:hypothetical protein